MGIGFGVGGDPSSSVVWSSAMLQDRPASGYTIMQKANVEG